MNGLYIKKVLIDMDVTQSALARKLNETPQNLNSALCSPDIRTGLLERIAKALDRPISFFYQGTEEECLFETPSAAKSHTEDCVSLKAYTEMVRENERLRMQIAQLQADKKC